MFYKHTWDPKLIIGQIISVQCLYYAILAGLLYILDSIFLAPLSLDQMFSFHALNTSDSFGWVVIVAFLMNSVFGSICLRYIVERSKKCLDHAATVMVIHLVLVWSFSGFPRTASWWVVQIICCIVMAIVGEYLCMRKELMDIPLSRARELDSTPILIPPQLSMLSSPKLLSNRTGYSNLSTGSNSPLNQSGDISPV
ncbi:hypothetical protein DFA_06022 [Cavenderia fasciculata]|uniref:Protein SYS1 homolog n=1 Tax=Cavenderia fasciculata TaxID=261658 RepID=F4PJW0_CACFS|nr:uncharacterized protein DFA_06022 [Cavenderia fasciculata]EGG23884.1 hypothetical protein DFA_06022 [Cavenderia fasciculata]|eukprot:XP_004361735.1 hypothetical protein DFA_06022 [Cavenderia fasciculata]